MLKDFFIICVLAGLTTSISLPRTPLSSGFSVNVSEFLTSLPEWTRRWTGSWLDSMASNSNSSNDIPAYVFEFAPVVHLFSGEQFWPCDMAEHLEHVTPHLNYTPISASPSNCNISSLNKLNQYNGGRFVYLMSDDNVEERPDWLGGEKNIPISPEKPFHQLPGGQQNQQQPVKSGKRGRLSGGRSDAPAVLVLVDKGDGIVDAFWFFFYSYNLGNKVFNVRFGNHIGDWEHSLVRFHNGKPQKVFVSEHYFGQAYTYDAVEKIGKRPVIYSAVGTHAMYATPGFQPYILPFGVLHDQTNRGPLWDPALNTLSYTYNYSSDILLPSTHNPTAATEWFYFNGHWGDKHYPLSDARQYEFAGEYHYVSGPLGPRFKHLGRRRVCQGKYTDPCVIRNWLPSERSLDDVRELERLWEQNHVTGVESDPPSM